MNKYFLKPKIDSSLLKKLQEESDLDDNTLQKTLEVLNKNGFLITPQEKKTLFSNKKAMTEKKSKHEDHIILTIPSFEKNKNNKHKDFLKNIKISISKTMIKEDEKKNSYTEYFIKCVLNDSHWVISKSFKDFRKLHKDLCNYYKELNIPNNYQILLETFKDLENEKNLMQKRKNALEIYLKDLSKLEFIRKCKFYQEFLNFNKEMFERDFSNHSECKFKFFKFI